MDYLPADYVIFGATAVAAVFGLFGGLSGALAFLAGSVSAALAGRFAWGASVGWFDAAWARGLASLAIALVAFGLARKLVRMVVHKILAQPGDAIFGILVSAVAGFALSLAVAYLLILSKILVFDSALLDMALPMVGLGGAA
jgi:hypothetical protein